LAGGPTPACGRAGCRGDGRRRVVAAPACVGGAAVAAVARGPVPQRQLRNARSLCLRGGSHRAPFKQVKSGALQSSSSCMGESLRDFLRAFLAANSKVEQDSASIKLQIKTVFFF